LRKPRTENQPAHIKSTLILEISKMEPTNTILKRMYLRSRSCSFYVEETQTDKRKGKRVS
jgi:hypothetical protein